MPLSLLELRTEPNVDSNRLSYVTENKHSSTPPLVNNQGRSIAPPAPGSRTACRRAKLRDGLCSKANGVRYEHCS